MRVYRKNLVWFQLAYCDKCGNDFWCKTNLQRDFKPKGLCEACRQQSLDEVINLMEKAGLAHQVETLKELVSKP